MDGKLISLIKRLFGFRSAVDARQRNPALAFAVNRSSELYSDTPLADLIDAEIADLFSRQAYIDLSRVCNSQHPVAACRQRLAHIMLKYALYQVIEIDAPPAEDASGLRGLPGITGEMRAYRGELAKKNMSLRSDLHSSVNYDRDARLRDLVRVEYWKNCWMLETLIETLKHLDSTVSENDWTPAFRHAACANQEHLYRIDLKMKPSLNSEDAQKISVAYSLFTDIVISDAADPMADWLDYHDGQGIPIPGRPLPQMDTTHAA